jgi:hypothetical protein
MVIVGFAGGLNNDETPVVAVIAVVVGLIGLMIGLIVSLIPVLIGIIGLVLVLLGLSIRVGRYMSARSGKVEDTTREGERP